MWVYYFLATFATMSQIVSSVMIFFVSKEAYEDLVYKKLSLGPELIARNILSNLASVIYSVYNIYYTFKLQALMKKHNNMRGEIRFRLIMQAIMIQILLTERILKTWIKVEISGNMATLYLFIMIIQFTSSGVIPFSWFSFTIAK